MCMCMCELAMAIAAAGAQDYAGIAANSEPRGNPRTSYLCNGSCDARTTYMSQNDP